MELRKWKFAPLVGVLVLVAAMAGACGGSPPEANQERDQEPAELEPASLGSGEKLQVVATTNILR
jgi:hypothetical protein